MGKSRSWNIINSLDFGGFSEDEEVNKYSKIYLGG